MSISTNEFHINRSIRDKCNFDQTLFSSTGNTIFRDMKSVRIFAEQLNKYLDSIGLTEKRISAGTLNAMGLIDEIFHYICFYYRKNFNQDIFDELLLKMDSTYGSEEVVNLFLSFINEFPSIDVYTNTISAEQYILQNAKEANSSRIRKNKEAILEELIMLHLANENPAFKPFFFLFDDKKLKKNFLYAESWQFINNFFSKQPGLGEFNNTLISFLKEPIRFSPHSLKDQLDYIYTHWSKLLGEWLRRLLTGIDTIAEEEKASWNPPSDGNIHIEPYNYDSLLYENERYSPDKDWMPKVVLLAKTVLVWLDQLSKKYKRNISRLDQIPDEELDTMANEGFTGLWLIGIWERSYASKKIKKYCGNPEAAASAYSLYDYDIAQNLGGWDALKNLRHRLWIRGIRLASDMVPNHTGMDSKWINERPDLFMQRRDNPYPQYSFSGENLSLNNRVEIFLEDHYFDHTDCAVVFKRIDKETGDTRYIYHGNDGTGLPWNDTAQIDFLNPEAREAVIQEILHVAENFPIIRFDAAMVLAKKHIRRLWYPNPGQGGDIATRSEFSISDTQFQEDIPNEFWREVVDRVAQQVPDTLLLAEAFWMMEGYFVRTLGMHRVYNSAFMNMLKNEENQKYRDTVKNTIKFDPRVLKRFVNFMNNPDEETAVAQFGKGEKYFGVCTLMITMPGLPMFGHGQIEGFEEKYGMEYTKAYRDEQIDQNLLNQHKHDIFPLMKKRYLFAEIDNFLFYDVWNNGCVNENIFAYSNAYKNEFVIVFYNNKYERASGWIKQSCEYNQKNTGNGLHSKSLAEGLHLSNNGNKYLIFREHHSNLWFVRSSQDICQNGLFISLNGFEYQVLMDIQEVEDTTDRKYSTLCKSLQGKGVYDIEIEWNEIKYKDLYKSLNDFLSSTVLNKIKLLFDIFDKNNKTQITPNFWIDLQEQSKLFYESVFNFSSIKDYIQNEKSLNKKNKFNDKTKFVDKLSVAFIEKLKILKKMQTENTKSSNLFDAAQKKDSKAFISLIFNKNTSNSVIFSIIFAIYELAQLGLARKWSFDRKLSEYLQNAGITTGNTQNLFTRLFLLCEYKNTKPALKTIKEQETSIIYFFVDDPYGRILSGTNYFNNVKWFNKEIYEENLQYFSFLQLLDEIKSDKKTNTTLKKYLQLIDIAEKSSYQCTKIESYFSTKNKTSSKLTKK